MRGVLGSLPPLPPPLLPLLLLLTILECGGALEGSGPAVEVEPAARVHFSNSSGGRLDCRGAGSPPPAAQWTLSDGGAAPNVSGLRYQLHNGSLVFPPFAAADFRPDVHRAAYRCVLSSPLGRAISRDVRLTAVVLQNFDVSVSSQPVTRGNAAVLRCSVPSLVRDYVAVTSWVQDQTFNIYPSSDGDGKFHMLPTGELVVLNANQADAFVSYQCRVTHRLTGEARVSARPARLTVNEPRAATAPQLPERQVSLDARRDEVVVIPCVALGQPPPEYRWEAKGTSLVEDEHRYTAGPLLVLPRVRPQDAGRYTCVASNVAGTARLDAVLVVTTPLSARIVPARVTAALGQSATFTCTPSGSPITHVYWTKDGQPPSARVIPEQGQVGTPVLRIPSVSREDQGVYQCFVKNDQDTVHAAAELRLGDTPPQVVSGFIRQTIQPGISVSLKCIASGNPTPNIRWALDGFALPQSDRFVIGQYVPMHGNVISHVNITGVRVEDGGSYRCSAANRVGEVHHQAQLNVYGPPHTRPMGEISAVAGENLVISCPAAGYPIEEIRWFRDSPQGDRLLPAMKRHLVFPNGTLIIEKVQAGSDSDGGHYRCLVTNKQGRSATSSAHVNVMVPPKITPFSFRADLHLGERVGVQCVVGKGDPPLEIHWLKDGRLLSPAEAVAVQGSSGASVAAAAAAGGVVVRSLDQFTSVLSIGALSRPLGGNYTCVARNPVARASHSAQLDVNVPPAITPFSFGELSAGERARVTCSVKRGDPPVSISWLKDGQPLLPSSPSSPTSSSSSSLQAHARGHDVSVSRDLEEFSSVLAIPSVGSRHSGNYTCLARNPAKTTAYTAPLLVTVPPTWLVLPTDRETRLGHPALLDCLVEGFPQPSITWRKAAADDPGQYQDVVGTEVPRAVMGLEEQLEQGLQGLDGGAPRGMAVLPNGSLALERVRQQDAGRYLCEASNGIGVGLSAVVTLTVHSPVHFAARSRKELARRGQTVTLSCTALGDLPISLSWRRGGVPIESGARHSIRNTTLANGLRSELLVQGLQTEDGGLYTCFGRNEYGYDQTQISLLVQDAPGAVGNLRLLEQTSRTATVAWSPPQDGNSIITRYVVRHRLLPARLSEEELESWEDGADSAAVGAAVEVSVDAPLQSAQLTALRPASLYVVSVLAENSLGLGPASKRLALRTDEEPPAAAPTHLAVEASSSTQLTVKWEAPSADSWHGPLLGHYVGHRELGRDPEGKRQYNFTTVPWSGGSGAGRQETTVLGGLSKYRQYGVVVQAYNPRGAGPLSTEVVAQTLEDVPESPPRDVHCAAESPESLRVNWQPPPEALVHGVIQGYRLLYQPVQDQLDVAETQNKMTTELSSTLHGLFKYTNYSVQVLAFTRVGDGNVSAPIYCRTKEDVPGQPGGVKAVLQSPDTALVTWLPPTHPNGQLTKYSVYVRDLEGGRQVDARNNPVAAPPVPTDPSAAAASTAVLQFRLPGMRKKHRYEFWVTAHTKVGEGQSSAVVALAPVANVTAAIVSFGGARVVTWKSMVRLGCAAVGQPSPSREWLLGDAALVPAPPRMILAADGALTINSAQRNDQGEYKCVVWNRFGRDHIVYQLIVQVPPSTPLLLSTGSSQHALQLQWKLGDDGGSPVRGFALHYKAEHGEWEERRVDGSWSTHTLSGLRCGTLYHVYVTAWNRVGSGPASQTLDLRTRGGVPAKAPAVGPAALVRPNATALQLRLDEWPDGGCPLLYFVVEFAPAAAGQRTDGWTVVSNNIAPGSAFQVSALSPGSEYRLRVTAHNEAGSTQAEYLAATLDAQGQARHGLQGHGGGPSHIATTTDHHPHSPFHQDFKMVVLTGVSVVALVLSFLALLLCLRKTRAAGSGGSPVNSVLGGVVGGGTATHDNKHNLARREQYYATVRKLPPSPATLECIPEYSDDIRPYATFQVAGSAESTKLQTFTYRERGGEPVASSPVRRGSKQSVQSEYCRPTRSSRKGSGGGRSCPPEEYESYGSESDTEPGTSSRTESSNQLDEHAYHFQLQPPPLPLSAHHQLHQLRQLQQLQQRQQLKSPADWSPPQPPPPPHPLRGRAYLPRS